MENNNLEKQTNESNPKSTRKIAIWCCVAAAICLVIATALVMHFRNSDGTIVSDTDTSASGRDTDQLQGSDTEAETEAPKPEFEISEAGVLTAYNGDDETVVIPDNVISIGADAFGASPRADAITTVKLGKSVEDIDVQAFASLTRLENVEVSEENGIFIFTDGVLIKADNSLFFCMPNIIKDDYDMFDVLYDYISNDEDACGIKQIISGKMIANVNVTEAENDLKDLLDIKYNIFCNSFYANGQNIDFDEPLAYIYAVNNSKSCHAYETNQGVVLSNTGNGGFGDIWILTNDSIAHTKIELENKFSNLKDTDYNYSVITFRRGKDGSLKYSRRPYKFITMGGTMVAPFRCTGFDEFAGETGNVEIVNEEIIYSPNRTWTVKEDFGLIGYLQDVFYLYNHNGIWESGEYETLEELLAHNSEVYESAK